MEAAFGVYAGVVKTLDLNGTNKTTYYYTNVGLGHHSIETSD